MACKNKIEWVSLNEKYNIGNMNVHTFREHFVILGGWFGMVIADIKYHKSRQSASILV